MDELKRLHQLWRDCQAVHSSPLTTLAKHYYFRSQGKNIAASSQTFIYGLANISVTGHLRIGLDYVGFMDHHDRTLLRVNGKMIVSDAFSIGKGCRLDIGTEAVVELSSGYINPNTTLIVMHGLKIGRGCSISWGCQFLDEDFHEISYPNKKEIKDKKIVIGNNVWIGSNVTVLKGAAIPDGSVVAAGSIVNAQFIEKNCLIAGSPAKIIRTDVSWK
jgi:acetyltransferase-like isoleucine patch superfamily enzyme